MNADCQSRERAEAICSEFAAVRESQAVRGGRASLRNKGRPQCAYRGCGPGELEQLTRSGVSWGWVRGCIWLSLVGSKLEAGKKRKGSYQLLIKSCGLELMNYCLAAWIIVRGSRLITCRSGYSRLASWAGYWRWWVGFLGRWPKAVDQSSIFTDGLVSVCNAHCCFPHTSPN